MDKHKYTFLVQGITPDEAMKTRVHLTWGQQWRERVVNAYATRAGTAVQIETMADFDEYGCPINASVGTEEDGSKEIDLTLAVDNDRYNRLNSNWKEKGE